MQALSDLSPLLFPFSHQNYVQYLIQHQDVELTNLSITKPQAFSDLEIFGLGASLSGKKFKLFQGDLVTEVTINREVQVKRGPPMIGG